MKAYGSRLSGLRLIAAVALLLTFVALGTPADGGPVYVTLWFDTEDYILPAPA